MTTSRPQCLCRWLDFEKHQNFGVISFSGVFVITHVDTCRGGAGYCILGFTCEIDKDFVADDLGGHCDGLVAAFNPKANFVCCRENPKTAQANEIHAQLQVSVYITIIY